MEKRIILTTSEITWISSLLKDKITNEKELLETITREGRQPNKTVVEIVKLNIENYEALKQKLDKKIT